MQSVRRNFVYNTAYQLVRVLAPLITMPYVSRVLGPSGSGLFSYTQSIAAYFVLFAILGMSKYGVRAIARTKNRAERSQTFWNIYLSQIVVALVVNAVYLGYCFTQQDTLRILSLAWAAYVLAEVIDVSWLFFGAEDFLPTAIVGAALQVIQVVLIFVLVKSSDDVWLYCTLIASYYFLSQAALWPFLKKFVDWAKPSWRKAKQHVLPSLKLFVPVIAISMYSYMDMIILGQLSTMEETGYYQYAYAVSTVPLSLITALGTVMLPKMSSLYAGDHREEVSRLVRLSLWAMLAAAFAFCWGIVGVAQEFVPVYLGGDYLPAIPTMIALAVLLPVISSSNVLGVQYLLPTMRDGYYTISLVVGAVINLLISIPLVGRYGALGSAVGTICAEVAVVVIQAILVRKELPILQLILDSIPHCVNGAIMAAALRFVVAPMLTGILGISLAELLFELLIGALIYVCLEIVFFAVTKNSLFKKVVGPYLPFHLLRK